MKLVYIMDNHLLPNLSVKNLYYYRDPFFFSFMLSNDFYLTLPNAQFLPVVLPYKEDEHGCKESVQFVYRGT